MCQLNFDLIRMLYMPSSVARSSLVINMKIFPIYVSRIGQSYKEVEGMEDELEGNRNDSCTASETLV